MCNLHAKVLVCIFKDTPGVKLSDEGFGASRVPLKVTDNAYWS